MNKSKRELFQKIALALALLLGLALLDSTKISAATAPQFLITWRAKNYVPPGFQGKILPGPGSEITASMELISGGRPVDLSLQTIYWYLNDNFIGGGDSKQSISFRAPALAPTTLNLRVQLPNYQGQLLLKSTSIPVVRPEAVIETPYPGSKFGSQSASLRGSPYFFSIPAPSLNFTWNVNGETPKSSENPWVLDIALNPDAPPGSNLNVALTIQNPDNPAEAASRVVNLTFTR